MDRFNVEFAGASADWTVTAKCWPSGAQVDHAGSPLSTIVSVAAAAGRALGSAFAVAPMVAMAASFATLAVVVVVALAGGPGRVIVSAFETRSPATKSTARAPAAETAIRPRRWLPMELPERPLEFTSS